jgi:hypothetical protein
MQLVPSIGDREKEEGKGTRKLIGEIITRE